MQHIATLLLLEPMLRLARIALLPGLLIGFAAHVHSATLTASLTPPMIALGEAATLNLSFEGGEPAAVPTPPTVPGLQISFSGRSSHVTMVNMAVTSSTILSYAVHAQRVGEFTIPSMTVNAGGQSLTTQPLRLNVTQPGSSVPGGAGDPLVILKLELPRKEVYVGEVMTVRLKLHLHSSIQNFGNFQLTSLPASGFNVGKIAEGERERVQLGNSVYTVIPILIALTPVKHDVLTIGPISARMVIQVPSNGRRRDVMDPFGMFDRSDQREVNIATEPESVEARLLPSENVPAGFSGAIGNYTLAFSASPTNIAAGDPITLKIQISGRGAFDALTLPEQPDWKEFKTYPPTSKIDATDPLGIEGTKTFEQVIVPQNTEISTLPAFQFSFFNPDTRRYETLRQGPIPLTVRPAGFTPPPTIAGTKTETPAAAADILPIRQRPGTLLAESAPLITRPGFLLIQALPAVAFLAAFSWRKRNELLANNPRLRRQRQVAQMVRDGLASLRQLAAENNSDAFFATVFRLLQEQLGERLDVPASSITESVIEERLRPRGVPDLALSALHELFQACNLARYAPIKSSQELAAFVPRVEAALRQVQEVKL